jgi:hypothetical protein
MEYTKDEYTEEEVAEFVRICTKFGVTELEAACILDVMSK